VEAYKAYKKWTKKYGNIDRKLRDVGGKSPQQKNKELQRN
jgi:hypothetical protein